MLADAALVDLQTGLTSALASMRMFSDPFGQPELVETVCKESEALFQGYAKARPSRESACEAALAFMRGEVLNSRQKNLVASALAESLETLGGASALGSPWLPALLGDYEAQARQGQLWRLTWYALLSSYFAFKAHGSTDAETAGWKALRSLLARTWPFVELANRSPLVPHWIQALRANPAVLTNLPADTYAHDFLAGETTNIHLLADDLGIAPSSWFWHALVLGAVRTAVAGGDAIFQHLIPQLIQLIEERPIYRDEALELILTRYFNCSGAPVHEGLRDFVIRDDIWKNPKLIAAGIASAWNRVPEPVCKMVLDWVNEGNQSDLFLLFFPTELKLQ